MKKCPRCKSILIKSSSQKYLCNTCGYITKNIQVAHHHLEFQEKINFQNKIKFYKNHQKLTHNHQDSHNRQQPPNSTQLKSHFITCFQKMLRTMFINLSQKQAQLKIIQYKIKYIWISYLHLANKHCIDITGLFKKVIKNNNKKYSEEQYQYNNLFSQNEDDVPQKIYQHQYQKQDYQTPSKYNEQSTKQPKKLKNKKKSLIQALSTHQQIPISLSLQIKKKLNQINHTALQYQQQTLLQFIYYIQQQNLNYSTINYLACKYVMILIKKQQSTNNKIKISSCKRKNSTISIKQLQIITQIRGLQFTQKNQIVLLLLLQDLLKKWCKQLNIQNNNHQLQTLLLLYQSPQNLNTKPIITSILNHLTQLITKQKQIYKQKQKPLILPQLSLNLAYAIIYIASLIHQFQFTIDDIVIKCSSIKLYYLNSIVVINQKINNKKIRKIAALLITALNLKCQPNLTTIKKWVYKYTKICGLQDYEDEITIISNVIYNVINMNNNKQHLSQIYNTRYNFLQQDIIAKAFILIFIKLQIGFIQYPYLSTFPVQLIHIFKSIQQDNLQSSSNISKYVQVLEQISNTRDKNISLIKIIQNLQAYYQQNSRIIQLKFNYSIDNYASLSNINLKNLIKLVKRNSSITYNFKPNFPINSNPPPQYPQHKIIFSNIKNEKNYTISDKFLQQLQFGVEDKQKGQLNYHQLDIPCSNYQFFYQYMPNIIYNQQLFLYFLSILTSKQCKIRQLCQWIQKLQKIIIQFQN